MKPLCLILSLGLSANLFATIRTVSNVPGTVAQYTNIQAASDAAVSGDTIYIQGSAVMYDGFTISNKRLIIIGPGMIPMQNFMPDPATVLDITINGSGSSRTEIQGLVVNGTITVTSFSHPDSLRFIRNRLST